MEDIPATPARPSLRLRSGLQRFLLAARHRLVEAGRALLDAVRDGAARLVRRPGVHGAGHADGLRQGLNVVLAAAQYATPLFSYVTGIGVDIATRASQGEPLALAPAGYTFGIWAYLYPVCLAYAVYQALPAQRTHPLLRRVGWYTALAFLSNACWALAAQLAPAPWYWLTVLCIAVMLAALVGAFVQVFGYRAPLSRRERYLVAVPIGVFTAWITVATIVNTAAMLQLYGFSGVLLSDAAWAMAMAAVAGFVGAVVTRVSRGDTAYALTVVWGLTGVVVEALHGGAGVPLAAVAAAAACAVLATWAHTNQPHLPVAGSRRVTAP